MMSKVFRFSLILTFLINSTHSLKILGLFPHPGLSHFHFFHPIMRGLADAGHDVTVLSHFPDKNAPPNYKDLTLNGADSLTDSVDLQWFSYRPFYQPFLEFEKLAQWGYEACELTLNSTDVQNLINTNVKFDVLLVEQFNSDCMMGLAWKLKAPVIGLSSCVLMPWHYDRFGIPWILSYITAQPLGSTDNMTYTERLLNFFYMNLYKIWYHYISLRQIDTLTRKYLRDENMPHLSELVKETSLMFLNTHYSLEGSRPNPPSIIEIGGIHITEPKPLDPELESFLNSAEDGVIYVSWGSLIRAATLPEDKRNHLLKAFGSFKQKVLWKFENETLANQPSNVLIRKWMPQKDILCHPNVRVFVSHGGLMGSSEAAYCGVPAVLTPMYGDQFHNSMAVKARGMGFIVQYEDITEKSVKAAIAEALGTDAQQNAKTVSYSYRNRPMSPLKTAIWWTEYVAAMHGAPLMKSHSVNMSAFTYYSFDVYATIAVILLPIVYLWVYIVRKCFNTSNLKSKKD
ncbi:UDP-glucuronosyltransferase 1-3-like isoform X2 [Contarinia nasturtii]|nr:UDP-glucuronosyltransferase 1-3-like isoform X2 [Contarinia nasturtii]XP_031630558.1 UDP-glucuronosyltransferase 1-3-like isoform X2 [Contarinia nasturtii]XP_031630559.1 UDP-glucuronosyltransferase 1-3-like isoform X2 [Contarinia nasturtii]